MDPNAAARDRLLAVRGEPLFFADWLRVVFLHFEVDPDVLQRNVPFALDLWQGRAYVSLVAFTMRDMRPRRGGKLGALLFKPIATHNFLNVRTYVKHHEETGIHFMTEWLDNSISVMLGQPFFGLPYRFGRLTYDHNSKSHAFRGQVTPRSAMPPRHAAQNSPCLQYRAGTTDAAKFRTCEPGSLDEFLLERYTAFNGTSAAGTGVKRFFRIWHPPWPQVPIQVTSVDTSLLQSVWPWFADARLVGAHYSPGVDGVWMGRPHLARA